jgi:hypothetical protein
VRAVHTPSPHSWSTTSARATAGTVATALMLAGLVGLGLAPSVQADGVNDGTPGQAEMDGETFGNGYAGGWGSLEGGVAARPVVRSLLVANGDAVRPVIDNPGLAPTPEASEGLDVVITPVNLCRPDQEPSQPGEPSSGPTCYASPNRISVTIGYTSGDQLRTNFFDPAAAGLLVTEATEFDLTLNLNTLGQSLRWTWLQGEPSYWRTTNLGQEDATLRVRFSPRKTPIAIDGEGRQMGCSQIPVNPTCEYPAATEYRLQASLVLSLDKTLDPAFTGSLFATENAYIGSLEATNTGTGPQMTWGIAAPLTVDGANNAARLWAVVPDAALLNYFGIPAEVDPATVLSGAIESGSTGARLTWQPWSADLRGTDGWLVRTPSLAIDETQVQSGGQSVRADTAGRVGIAARTTVAEAVKINVRRKAAAPQVSASFKSSLQPTPVSFRGTAAQAKTCGKVTCRVVFSRLGGAVSSGVTQIGTSSAKPGRDGLVVTRSVTGLRVGQGVLVVLQQQKNGRWTYLSSGVATVRRK